MTRLTLAITAHDETHVAVPTIRSAVAAMRAAEASGIEIELLIGFDCAGTACREMLTSGFRSSGFSPHVHEVSFRDQGATRNALVDAAGGRYLAFLDADDLFSANWLAAGVARLDPLVREGHKAVAHPELQWQFDGAERVVVNCGSDDPFFSLHVLAVRNYYDALCIAPIEAWREVSFAPRDLAQGFALEDYQWVVETVFAGWQHVIVPDTIIFKRKRAQSQSRNSRQANAMIRQLDSLRIDRVRRGLRGKT